MYIKYFYKLQNEISDVSVPNSFGGNFQLQVFLENSLKALHTWIRQFSCQIV